MSRRSGSMIHRGQCARFIWSRMQAPGAANNRAVDALAHAAQAWRQWHGKA